jgi:hypothetical protein
MQRNYSSGADSPNHDGAPPPADFVNAQKLILWVDFCAPHGAPVFMQVFIRKDLSSAIS